MKTVRHYNEFGYGPLEFVDPEHAFRSQHRQPVKGVVPEVAVASQSQERFQQWPDLVLGELLQERLLQRLHKVTESDRILLIVRMVPMRRLVERKARGITIGQEPRCIVLIERVHCDSSLFRNTPHLDACSTALLPNALPISCGHRRRPAASAAC
jgi:hypothetical protein